jgi:hypothetical protein
MGDLVYRPASELLTELGQRRVSARELLEEHLTREGELHGQLNAVVATDLIRPA